MSKLIAGMNMTLDGFCDHTAMIADAEVHQHYADLLNNSDTLIIWKSNLSTDGKLLAGYCKKSYRQQSRR